MDYNQENEKRFCTLFMLENITKVIVTFEGSGDSGQIDNISIERSGDSVIEDLTITIFKSPGACFNRATQKWEEGEVIEEVTTLQQALKYHVYVALEASNVDWYNDDGGSGEWIWTIQEGLFFDISVRTVTDETAHREERKLGEYLEQEA
jgi:hypothetical protein